MLESVPRPFLTFIYLCRRDSLFLMFHDVMLNRIFANECFLYTGVLSRLGLEGLEDLIHRGSLVGADGPTKHHIVPQLV